MELHQLLKEKTFKDDGLEHSRRVFYTLTQPPAEKVQAHRTAKLLSLVVQHLIEQERLSEAQLDAMLLEVIS